MTTLHGHAHFILFVVICFVVLIYSLQHNLRAVIYSVTRNVIFGNNAAALGIDHFPKLRNSLYIVGILHSLLNTQK